MPRSISMKEKLRESVGIVKDAFRARKDRKTQLGMTDHPKVKMNILLNMRKNRIKRERGRSK